jgi:hypothetical protein
MEAHMRKKSPTPTQQRVCELFTYDPETGDLTRIEKARSWGAKETRRYGKVGAGSISSLGYVMVTVDGHKYNAGQIIWLYVHGEWPKRIKYVNGVKADNRLSNIVLNNRDRDEVTDRPLTQERLKELLHYDPITGWFTWRVQSSMMHIGARAGGLHGFGYRNIGIDYNKYLEHHLAWLYMTGEWPEFEVDHKNRIRDDNRWDNLADKTKSQNGHNKGLHPKNTTGYPGVSTHGDAYRATIAVRGTDFYLGRFKTIAETRVARLLAEIEHFGHCTTFDELRDRELPSLGGSTVRIELCSSEVRGQRCDGLSVYNHHGVPFWVKGVRTISGIIGSWLDYKEEQEKLGLEPKVGKRINELSDEERAALIAKATAAKEEKEAAQ